MDVDVVADLSSELASFDNIHSEGGIRVMAVMDGERVQVGTGYLVEETKEFKASITDERAKALFDTFVAVEDFSISNPEVEMVRRNPVRTTFSTVVDPMAHKKKVKAKARSKNNLAKKSRKKNR